MRLIEFLESTDYYDGEIYTSKGAESKFSFVWDEGYEFTDEGKTKYTEILNSEMRMDANTNIILMNDDVTEELLEEFLALCAGHIAQSEYDKYIKEVQNE